MKIKNAVRTKPVGEQNSLPEIVPTHHVKINLKLKHRKHVYSIKCFIHGSLNSIFQIKSSDVFLI